MISTCTTIPRRRLDGWTPWPLPAGAFVLVVALVLVAVLSAPARGDWIGRGDANGDGVVDIRNAIRLFDWLSTNPDAPICLTLIDANNDGKIDYSDGIYLLYYMFLHGEEPTAGGAGSDDPCARYAGTFDLRNEMLVGLTPTSALLTWETEIPASTRVIYGVDAEAPDLEVDVQEMVLHHQTLLQDLRPGTTYYYRLVSEAGNVYSVTSETRAFRTLPDAGYTVRQDHPRIFLRPEDIGTIRAKVAPEGKHAALWKLIAEWCRSRTDMPASELLESVNFLDHVRAFAFVALVGEDAACRDKAVELGLALADLGANGNVRAATEAMAFVHDWLYAELSDSDRQKLADRIWKNCAILDGMIEENEFVTGMSHGHSKSLFLGLLSIQSDQDLRTTMLLAKVVRYYRYGFLATWRRFGGLDGGSSKGWGYSSYVLPFEYEFLAGLRSATGEDWFGVEGVWLEGVVDWFLFGLRGDGSFVREGDSYVRDGLEYRERLFGSLVAREFGNAGAQWLAGEARAEVGIWAPHAVFDILWHEPLVPTVQPFGPTSRWFRGAGVVICRESWSRDAAIATFRSPEAYVLGHSHLDTCGFTLFYRGSLALDTGIYDEFDSEHHENYYSRTIAHNAILVQDPDETFQKYGTTYSADGGQRWLQPWIDVPSSWPARAEDTVDRSRGYRLGGIVRYEDDARYTYTVGDGGPAYSRSKMEKFHRHFLWLKDVAGWAHPVLIVLDDVVSKRAEFRKTYLLHTVNEPRIEGNQVVAETNGGVLYQWTLSPADAMLVPVGGPGREFWVDGKNYPPSRDPKGKEEPGAWRVEISPGSSRTSDRFVHVLYPGDSDAAPPAPPAGFNVGPIQGVALGEWMVLINTASQFLEIEYDSPLPASSHLILGAAPVSSYELLLDDRSMGTLLSTYSGSLRFDLQAPGSVRLRAKI